jgi:hypothetical protein
MRVSKKEPGATRLPLQLAREEGVMVFRSRVLRWILVGAVLTVASVVSGPSQAVAVEVGQPAPEFKLPASTGADVSLSDFRGKKWVLLEFYGADFVPT